MLPNCTYMQQPEIKNEKTISAFFVWPECKTGDRSVVLTNSMTAQEPLDHLNIA